MIPTTIRNWTAWFLLAGLGTSVSVAKETQRVYLSGRGKDDAVPWRFMCTTGALSGFWTNLPVPSNWDVKGFGHLTYKKDYSNAITECGLYEKDFAAPKKWKDQRVFLVFEGAMTDTSAKLNGASVGPTHQGGFYRFKYEVTDRLKLGAENKLEVTVAKHSANESVNKAERLADYWVFGGIYRPVYLEVVPQQFIEHVAIDARADGTFAMEVFVSGETDADAVEAQIVTLQGKKVGGKFSGKPLSPSDGEKVAARPGEGTAPCPVRLQTRIASPKLWTAETPNLYRVEVRLKRGKQVLHKFTERFGFRTFEVRDGDGLYLNGQKIILKGVNRHSFWPDSGRCLSTAVHKLDIETIKDMNGNAVRMSHYPPDAEFLELCDELGLYVLDEIGGWQKFYDTEIGTKIVAETVTRDVNHPSILFWDNGNEGGFNTNLDKVFPEFDPQKRRVLHPWATFNGLNTTHYLAYDKAEAAAAGFRTYYDGKENVASNDPLRYIYLPTEFIHGLYDGGAGAGFEDYWGMMMKSPLCAGGFIWVFADEGIKRPDTGLIDVAGNQAPDGIVGPYREREGSFYAIKDIWSPIQVRREADGRFSVENHFGFTDVSECKFTWEQSWLNRSLKGSDAGHRVERSGAVKLQWDGTLKRWTGVLPHDELGTNAFTAFQETDTLALRVTDPQGRELRTWVWPELVTARVYPPPNAVARSRATISESGETIAVRAQKLAMTISKRTGMLDGVEGFSFRNGPRPIVGQVRLRSITSSTNAFGVMVTALFDGGLDKVVWMVRGDGLVMCHYSYSVTGTNETHGVCFDYPEELVRGKRWLGDGPFRVWQNRLGGGTLNVWRNDYNNTITGWRDWIYPEFKGIFANVYWLQLQTTEGTITAIPQRPEIFVQVLTPEQPPDNLVANTRVNLPQCGLGFLHAIPPIGTKFKPANQGGPQGQRNVGPGEYSGSVSFYFGPLP